MPTGTGCAATLKPLENKQEYLKANYLSEVVMKDFILDTTQISDDTCVFIIINSRLEKCV